MGGPDGGAAGGEIGPDLQPAGRRGECYLSLPGGRRPGGGAVFPGTGRRGKRCLLRARKEADNGKRRTD